MDLSSAQHQDLPSHSLENMLACTKAQQEKKPRPQPEQALKCPRCDSTNTKFCYYNNYSLSQPRYFCKSCRRYWTKGGTLRNVPVGGGCRKNKRSSSSTSSSKRIQDQSLTPTNNPLTTQLPPLSFDSASDLTLALARLQKQTCGQMGFDHDHHDHLSIIGSHTSSPCDILGNLTMSTTASSTNNPGFLEALRSGFLENNPTSGLQNMYYGYNGNGNMGEVDDNNGEVVGVSSGEMIMPYDQEMSTNATTTSAVAVTTMKQEICNARDYNNQSDQNRYLWGFPWQQQMNGDGNMGDINDQGRANWNTPLTSWHGLLNSPLM